MAAGGDDPRDGLPGPDGPSPAPAVGAGDGPGSAPRPVATPGAGFASALAAAFRRHRPQGSTRWNFSAAFTRLEERFGTAAPGPHAGAGGAGEAEGLPEAAPGDAPGGAGAPGTRSTLHRLADRYVTARVQPWIEEIAATAARRATEEALAREDRSVREGFGTTVEAFRFLGARVEALEDASARRRSPVDAVWALAPPPPTAAWAAPVLGWLRGSPPPGTVLHGECGDGGLVRALVDGGVEARGAEPRGAAAWRAAAQGVAVEVGEVGDALRPLATGSLGGLVLSGIVDRAPLDDLVALVALATDRLAPGAPLVVLGTAPAAAASGWAAVARDLLPGRPLHPETWELLLGRAGYLGVGRLEPADGTPTDTFAVGARRPS